MNEIKFVLRGYACVIDWDYNAVGGVTVNGGIDLHWHWGSEPVYDWVISAPAYYMKTPDPIGDTFDKVQRHLETYLDGHERHKLERT